MIAERPRLYPSFQQGFARSIGESAFPDLWRGLVGLWAPEAGYQGITTLKDFSGYGNHGTLNGSMTNSDWLIGKNGYALDFDGTDDYIRIPDSPSLRFVTYGTIMTWLKWDGVAAYALIVSKKDGAADYVQNTGYMFYLVSATANDIIAGNSVDISSYLKRNTDSIDTNWHHWAAVYNNLTLTLYKDGIEQGGSYSHDPQAVTAGTADLLIGARTLAGATPSGGPFYDLRIYNRALSASEIMQSYLGASPLQRKDFIYSRNVSSRLIKTINGLILANVKTHNGLATATMKTRNGLP